MNKAYGIKANNFEELINQINKFAETHKTFSTQFLEPRDNFYCIVWYESEEPKKEAVQAPNKEIKPSSKPTDKPYKMKDVQWDMLIKISNNPQGKEYLESKGIYWEEDLYELTGKEAYELINKAPKMKK